MSPLTKFPLVGADPVGMFNDAALVVDAEEVCFPGKIKGFVIDRVVALPSDGSVVLLAI